MPLDFTKPLLSDGHPVRILCTDGPGDWPIIGIVNDAVHTWKADGSFFLTDGRGLHDLTQAPEPAKLQLREGGYYRHPNGHIIGPISSRYSGTYRWSQLGSMCAYDDHGQSNHEAGAVYDLVSEVTVTDVPLVTAAPFPSPAMNRPGMPTISVGTPSRTTTAPVSPVGIDVLPQIGPQPGSVDAPALFPPPSPDDNPEGRAFMASFTAKRITVLESRIAELTKCHDDDVSSIQQLHDRIAELTKPQPEKQCAGWVNVYEDGFSRVYMWPTRELADDRAKDLRQTRIACVPVMFTPGEGIGGEK